MRKTPWAERLIITAIMLTVLATVSLVGVLWLRVPGLLLL
ncbi:Uncharacterised protein [Cedecea davisae]|uniref:Uncharacterized protein n=1 Tax=Cedecea davisae DSM 4568 TaxID=566551 RepID=S3IVJ1_9ENTR|nr:hypothetical protein HMPREF0201_02215 [Cedecea davisae DSM 4568]SUX27596.1 Uncharacterised protein [Cedecea davisae]